MANLTQRTQLQESLLTRAQLLRNVARRENVLRAIDARIMAKRQSARSTFTRKDVPELNNSIAAEVLSFGEDNGGDQSKQKTTASQTCIPFVHYALFPGLDELIELERTQVGDTQILTASLSWRCKAVSNLLSLMKANQVNDPNSFIVRVLVKIFTVMFHIVNGVRSGDNDLFKTWFPDEKVTDEEDQDESSKAPKTPIVPNVSFNIKLKQLQVIGNAYTVILHVHNWFHDPNNKHYVDQLNAIPGLYDKFQSEVDDLSTDVVPKWCKFRDVKKTPELNDWIKGHIQSLLPNVTPHEDVDAQIPNSDPAAVPGHPESHQASQPQQPLQIHTPHRTPRKTLPEEEPVKSPMSIRRSKQSPLQQICVTDNQGRKVSPELVSKFLIPPTESCLESGHVQGVNFVLRKHLDVTTIVNERLKFKHSGSFAVDMVHFNLNPKQYSTPEFCKNYVDSLKTKNKVMMIFANPPWGIWNDHADEPLTANDIEQFVDCFDHILDDHGTILLEPGPNWEQAACWQICLIKKVSSVDLFFCFIIRDLE